jgi:xeroderma pigmentosum group C-complementing protein
LKRDDAVLPNHTKVSEFLGAKGTSTPEAVYARSSIVTVKSVEGYMKIGRRIKKDEIPYKWVKARNVTINKKRLEEAAKELEIEGEGEDREGQPLYGEDQTEWYIAEPIVDVRASPESLLSFKSL